MNQEPIDILTLTFQECDAGWIKFSLAAGKQSVNVRASELFDPFPDLLRWMHAILTGVEECSFTVDEEGCEKTFSTRQKCGGKLFFSVVEAAIEPETLLSAVVSQRQLIDCFYNGVREFARSPLYRPREWERETMGDRFRRLLPLWDEGTLLKHLAGLTREELREALFKADPSYRIDFPDEPDEKARIVRAVEYMRNPDDPAKAAGVHRTPFEWPVPEDFDRWPLHKRTEYVLECLREQASSYAGFKLREWKSGMIERYLSHPELDAPDYLT